MLVLGEKYSDKATREAEVELDVEQAANREKIQEVLPTHRGHCPSMIK